MPSRPPETRLDFAFTERDTPALRKRIESDLHHVARRAHETDPHLEALVLTGGFSRGEGTAREDAPVNDYDLVAIRARPGGGGLRALAHELTHEIGLEVDLLPTWRARLPHVGRKLFWLDVRLGARVVSGNAHALDRLRRFEPHEIHPREIARLLGNRAAGMLLSIPAPGEPPDAHQRDLQATKAVLAALDATLLHDGRYAARLRDRLRLARGHTDHALFDNAVRWKLDPREPLPDDWWEQARGCLLRAVEATHARRARDGPAEHAFHLLRARRIAWQPSQDVRRRAWDALAGARWPHGTGEGWGEEKRALVAARERTLQ